MGKETLSDNELLYAFWERATPGRQQAADAPPDGWEEQVRCLSQYGRGMEEALEYLYTQRPSFGSFEDWLQQTWRPASAEVWQEPVLTEEDRDFWDRNGYIVIRNAVPKEQVLAAQAAIWEFRDADPSDPPSWYRSHPRMRGLMLGFFQHPALDANRRSGKIRKAYEELYQGTDIYLLMDKVSFNPPQTDTFTFQGSPLHWDVSLHPPIPFVLQGLLYLTDVDSSGGAFSCVPGFHKQVETWLAGLPADADPRAEALKELTPVPVTGSAGDLVIWHQALPHCATPNTGSSPRMVQYITYKPVKTTPAAIWK